MVASVAALGMSLDLGRLYFLHRDLQLVADMAALDAARSAGGCLGQVDDPHGAAAGEAAASVQRNGTSLAYLTAGAVEIGRQETVGGVRGFVSDDSPGADAVRVTLRRPLPNKLIPLFSSNQGGVMTTSAAATLRPIVSLDVASSLAEVNPDVINAALGGMLGNNSLALSTLSYGGLFNASVSLGDLAAAANAGGVDDFLDTQTTAPGLLDVIATAVGLDGNAAVRATLDAISGGSDTSRTVVPRQVLGVPAGATADDALVNVGALVSALAQAANGDNALELAVPVDLPGIARSKITLRLLELARPAIGPATTDAEGQPQTFANTAQGLLQAEITFGQEGVPRSPISVSLYLQLADASAAVTDLHCAQRGRPQAVVAVQAHSGVGGIGIGSFDIRAETPPTFPLPATPIVDLSQIGVPVRLVASAHGEIHGGEEASLQFEGPFPSPPQTIGTDPASAIAAAVSEASESISFDIDPVIQLSPEQDLAKALAENTVRPLLDMALRRLNEQLLAPLADVLGASAGTARIQVRSVVAQQPVLFAR